VARSIVHVIRQFTSDTSETTTPSVPVPHTLPWFSGNAHKLTSWHRRPLVVGVFQRQSLEEIQRIVSDAQIDLVQLHGDEPLHWARHLSAPVIKVFHLPSTVVNEESASSSVENSDVGLQEITRPGLHEFVLLDSMRSGSKLSGGSGTTLDWDVAKKIVEAGEILNGRAALPMPVILAGGLTVDNVASAVACVKPWAVDVSGGVETDGTKDLEKITAFVRAAKSVP